METRKVMQHRKAASESEKVEIVPFEWKALWEVKRLVSRITVIESWQIKELRNCNDGCAG